jgi:hypothetical protein
MDHIPHAPVQLTTPNWPRPEVGLWESQMTAVAPPFLRVFLSTSGEFDFLKQLALLCGAGLLVFLLMLTYGVNLSPGFF